MSLVDVHNEWDPLEDVIVGTARGARIPSANRALHAIEYADLADLESIPSGPLPSGVLEQTEEELDGLAALLTSLGVNVRRPEPRRIDAQFGTPDWTSDGFYDYCPRDVLLSVADTVIETPMVQRSRMFEPFAYRDLMLECLDTGARWISAPKPQLLDGMFDATQPMGHRLRDDEPAFDAANVLRLGTDLVYLVSDSGNERGHRWLQSTLGDRYVVHPCRGLYASTHIDSTIVPLQPGLVLLNPERVNDDNLPAPLRTWDKLWCPELEDPGHVLPRAMASRWIGMNLLVVRPGLVIADDRQPALRRTLESAGIDVAPHRLTHARSLGGGFHCVTLDLRRTGRLESYR